MDQRQLTNSQLSYRDWFMACSNWWDQAGWEEAYDYPWLPWEQWYAAGLTVDAAVRLAHRETFGEDLPA